MQLNPEVPQWLLDIFNKINFKKVPGPVKFISLQALEKWADANLRRFDQTKTYPKPPKRTIKADFDEKLITILNKYEYSYLTSEDRKQISNYLKNMISTMPVS